MWAPLQQPRTKARLPHQIRPQMMTPVSMHLRVYFDLKPQLMTFCSWCTFCGTFSSSFLWCLLRFSPVKSSFMPHVAKIPLGPYASPRTVAVAADGWFLLFSLFFSRKKVYTNYAKKSAHNLRRTKTCMQFTQRKSLSLFPYTTYIQKNVHAIEIVGKKSPPSTPPYPLLPVPPPPPVPPPLTPPPRWQRYYAMRYIQKKSACDLHPKKNHTNCGEKKTTTPGPTFLFC